MAIGQVKIHPKKLAIKAAYNVPPMLKNGFSIDNYNAIWDSVCNGLSIIKEPKETT